MTAPIETKPATAEAEPLSSRALAWLIGLGLGALFGVMGTAVSQTVWNIAPGVGLPTGMIVALLAVTLLFVGLRLIMRTRTVAILAAFGVVAAIFLLSQPSSGGSVLVPANGLGITWTFAPTVIALVVLAWPRFSKN